MNAVAAATDRFAGENPAAHLLPTRVVTSAWLQHAPFAFWIMDALRPSAFVELGTHNGFSFFTFCEAAQIFDLDTHLSAIDTWRGDDHAGFYDDSIYQDVAAVQGESYSERASLLRGYFDDFVDQFEDGSIDLLHIDGRHGYEDVRHDFEAWLPKVSSRGVVLFHDIAERQEGFGVWQFWDEIRSEYPSFTFEHEHGLGVLAIGPEVPGTVLEFLAAANAEPARTRLGFERLGARVTRTAELLRAEQECEELRVALEHWKDQHSHALEEVRSLELQRDEVFASTSWKVTAPLRAVGGLKRRGSR